MENKTEERKYYITDSQLYKIERCKMLLEYISNDIQSLCSKEKDDIIYGFELGRIYSDLRINFVDFLDLNDEIHNQEI